MKTSDHLYFLKTLCVLTALAISTWAVAPPVQGQSKSLALIDRIAAIADNSLIMESEFEERLQAVKDRLRTSQTQVPPDRFLENQVMEQLIVESLIKEQAARANIQVSSAELNQALERIANQSNYSLAELYESLKQEGIAVDKFLSRIRDDLLIQKTQQALLRSRISITEEEIDRFLASTAGDALLGREYLVSHILLPFEDDPQKATDTAKIIEQKLKEGSDFESLAVEFSQSRTALQGGSLGWRKPSQLPNIIAQAIRTMQVGDYSAPLDDDFALHIIRLTDRRGKTVRYTTEYLVSHLLLKPSAIRTLEQTETELTALRNRITEGEEFTALARIYSEDPDSALSEGNLGWVQIEQLPPDFATVIDALTAGTLSEPFQTEAGWHVAIVHDKRTSDLTEELSRNHAIQSIFERKFEEELDRYLHEIRSQAYVDLKIDIEGLK
ncbi:MAG: peptidylprolyl isomerase [Gammaproteobacteria bacterium]